MLIYIQKLTNFGAALVPSINVGSATLMHSPRWSQCFISRPVCVGGGNFQSAECLAQCHGGRLCRSQWRQQASYLSYLC